MIWKWRLSDGINPSCSPAYSRFFGIDRWDMADFMVASVCFSFHAMKYDLSKFPALQKWLAASLERPQAREAIALRG